jgi:hypothetical protein
MSSMDTTAEFDGQCAFAVSVGKTDVDGSPSHRLEDGDKIYYFKNGAARFLWKVLPDRSAKATEAWAGR